MVTKLLRKSGPEKQSPTAVNFISYNNLAGEKQRLFASAHLHHYLNDAVKLLFPADKAKPLFSQKAGYSPENLAYINARINFALELIGEYSNPRFGRTAAKQHSFFQRPTEQEVFFTYLFQAVQTHKKSIIVRKNPKAAEIGTPYLNKAHVELEAYRKKGVLCFKILGKNVPEKEIYAACVFYAMNFVLDAAVSDDALRLSRLLANMFHFGSGTSYHAADGKKGGESRARKWAATKEKAYALFVRHDVHKKFGPKHDAIQSRMTTILRTNRVRVSPGTLKTKWIPEFVRRYKSTL